MEARACFLIIVFSIPLLLLLGVRDHRGVERLMKQSREQQIECVAERYAAGATTEMALSLCGGLDPYGLEVALP